MKRTTSISAALVFAGLGLSGCAGVAANAGEETRGVGVFPPSLAQENALADGVVDEAEYEAGFAAFQACMTAGGYIVEVRDNSTAIIDYRYLAQATDDGTADRCYQIEFAAVDESWQTAHQDEQADSALLDACLSENGLAIPTTRQEKVDALVRAGVDLGRCMAKG
ncbi:hypothetical protein NVV95_08560 [Herbiconiux sp. CPCC 205716]|uniref:Lipoprotein n=1 Tax=Herbiconiux gentiana TaxID=2970912 RepID=A0ABT2GEG8_9MICO|nr:hypothetical protein [Herbiconiux gentiana]MCS5714603.1 hypothetical protein [Herbiconiux gentiana]